MTTELLLLIPVVLLACLGREWFLLERETRASDRLLRLRAIRLREGLARMACHERLAKLQNNTENTIGNLTQVVHAVHHAVAAVPFGILESVPETQESARRVRAIHDMTADKVYGAVHLTNKLLGHGLRSVAKLDGDKKPE